MTQLEKIEKYRENYYALAISICTQMSPPQALAQMGIKSEYKIGEDWGISRMKYKKDIERDWLKERLDEGLVYGEIATLAKCSVSKVAKSVKEYGLKRKKGWKKGKVVEYEIQDV